MTDMKKSWEKAGSKLSALGLKLKYHFEEERSEDSDDEDDDVVRSAVEKLREAFDDAFDAIENAAKDPAVKEDVKMSALLLRDALAETFSEAGDTMRKAFSKLERDPQVEPSTGELPGPEDSDQTTE
ncbi:MAG: hypothetical protein HKO03_05685 [Acidimicrobiia bacterium]|nr:hypothetical protein [Acidimicrobiia bacterium]NND14529.1 hypothetical protein [Acidimicrobiia bacterium]